MNIQNLNKEELQQLQTLLNKMNPTQDKDPVDKMIDDIIENFNFDRVQRTMDFLRWKWVGQYVTVEMLLEEARRLLKGAAKSRLTDFKDEYWEMGVTNGTGGFQAKAYCNEAKTKIIALDLKFVLTEWDEQIED
jgi:hypothetical protein